MSFGSDGRNAASAGSSAGPETGPRRKEDGPELRPQLTRHVEEASGLLLRSPQSALVRDLLRQLERELEAVRHARGPPLHCLRARRRVESRIHLDRVERLRVGREEVGGLRPRRVERADPGVVVPALGAESDGERAASHERNRARGTGAVKQTLTPVSQRRACNPLRAKAIPRLLTSTYQYDIILPSPHQRVRMFRETEARPWAG